MKKIIAMLLALVMVLGCLAACNQTPPAETKDTTPPKETTEYVAPTQNTEKKEELGKLPLTEEDVTITIGIPHHLNTQDYETNDYTLWIEDQTGINLDFVTFSNDGNEAVTQLNLMISGNEKLPDILWGFGGVSNALMYELGEDGYFVDIKDYFSEYGYWFWEALNQCNPGVNPKIFQYGTDPNNGALYAFPRYSESLIDSCNALAQINTQWLEAIGAEMPTTVDELYDVLKKFAAEDPNGNGVADELPLIGYDGGYRTDIVSFVINAFVYCNDQSWFNVTDGEVWVPYTTDEYRQAMIYLNKLYSESLLSPLFYSVTSTPELKALLNPADEVAIGGVVGAHPTLHWEKDNAIINEYTALAPLKGATELGGYAPLRGDTYEYITFITTDAEDPVLCFKLLDFMCSQDSFLRMRYGVEGVDWEYCEEGMYSSTGGPACINVIDSAVFSSQNNKNWHYVAATVMPAIMSESSWIDDGTWASVQTRLNAACYQSYMNGQRPEETIQKLVYNADELAVVSNIQSQVNSYIFESRALFISGVMDPNDDAQWEAYLANMKAQGMDKWLTAAQSAYTRMNSQ